MSEGKKEILLGDCLELMKDIPNGSIDMILMIYLMQLQQGTNGIPLFHLINFGSNTKGLLSQTVQ